MNARALFRASTTSPTWAPFSIHIPPSGSDSLQSIYDAYAKSIINRRMLVPGDQVADAVELAKAETTVRRKAVEIYDNRFAADLEKSGFLKEIWGGKVP